MVTREAAPSRRPMTGAEYLESIRDGREVYVNGERVRDVTTHPAFRNAARMTARFYDALHDRKRQSVLTTHTDTGNSGYTHRFYKIERNADEVLQTRDAIAEAARIGFGWLGRLPDYKASFLGTLGANADWYGEYADNARNWYSKAQNENTYLAMSLVNPPIDRTRPPEDVADFLLRAERETDQGVIVSGVKCVATGAATSNYDLVGFYGPTPLGKPQYAIFAFLPLNAPGLKIISRTSYEANAAISGSVFDYPLASRLDENDSIIVLDQVLVPWENILIYRDVERANNFFMQSGWVPRFALHGATRLGVKLDFLAGLLILSSEATGASANSRLAQMNIGEVLSWRHLVWGLTQGLASGAEPWKNGTVLPNLHTALAYRGLGPTIYTRVKELMQRTISSGLIYLNSHAADFSNVGLRGYLDKYLAGNDGTDAETRVKTLKAAWDALCSDFGGRHDMYERSFAGNFEAIRIDNFHAGKATGHSDQLKGFVQSFLDEYDSKGWRVADMFDSGDVNQFLKGDRSPFIPSAKPKKETRAAGRISALMAPYEFQVEAGTEYWWCACGQSKSQPFCDGSHKGTGVSPVQYKAEKTESVWFCGCKATSREPLCDGSHKKL